MTETFLTPYERAAAVAVLAMEQGLWTPATAAAFVAYAGDDPEVEEHVGWWEKQMADLLLASDDVTASHQRLDDVLASLREELEASEDYYKALKKRFTDYTPTAGPIRNQMLLLTGRETNDE